MSGEKLNFIQKIINRIKSREEEKIDRYISRLIESLDSEKKEIQKKSLEKKTSFSLPKPVVSDLKIEEIQSKKQKTPVKMIEIPEFKIKIRANLNMIKATKPDDIPVENNEYVFK